MTDMEPENPGPLLKYMRSRNADLIETLTAKLQVSNELGKALEEDAGQLREENAKLTAERDRLREAMEKLACKCSSNCDWEHEDVCPSWIASVALKGESHE